MWPQTHSPPGYIDLYDFLVHIGYPTPESIMHETDELCPLAHGLLCSICDKAARDMLINLIIHGLVLGAGHKAKRLVLQCINGVSSNPVEGRTTI